MLIKCITDALVQFNNSQIRVIVIINSAQESTYRAVILRPAARAHDDALTASLHY